MQICRGSTICRKFGRIESELDNVGFDIGGAPLIDRFRSWAATVVRDVVDR